MEVFTKIFDDLKYEYSTKPFIQQTPVKRKKQIRAKVLFNTHAKHMRNYISYYIRTTTVATNPETYRIIKWYLQNILNGIDNNNNIVKVYRQKLQTDSNYILIKNIINNF